MEMNCGNCKYFWADNIQVCRRNPPQGKMDIIPNKLVGAPPTVQKISFFPPVNSNMWCGQHELSEHKETNDAQSLKIN